MILKCIIANSCSLYGFSIARREVTHVHVSITLFSALPILRQKRLPGSILSAMEHWCRGLCSIAAASIAGAHYEPTTFILRQSPCADFEANFIYLLIGADKALLIDTGAVRLESNAVGENDHGAVAG